MACWPAVDYQYSLSPWRRALSPWQPCWTTSWILLSSVHCSSLGDWVPVDFVYSSRFHLLAPHLQMSFSNLTTVIEYQWVFFSMAGRISYSWWCHEIDGLVQERRNSSALAMELRLSCTNPLKWKHFAHHCPFVRGIHRPPVDSPTKGQGCGALIFGLLSARIGCWTVELPVVNWDTMTLKL